MDPLVPRDMCGSLEYRIRNFVFYQPECHSNVMEIVALPRLYHSQNPGPKNLRTAITSFLASHQQHKKHTFTLSLSLCIPLWTSPTLSFRPKSSRPPHALSMMSSHTLGRPNLVDPSLNPSLTSHPKLACLSLPPAAARVLFVMFAASASAALFDGDCYVFDQRVAVMYGNQPSTKFTESCKACQHPLSKEDMEGNEFVEGLSCRWYVEQLTEKQRE
jgi:hypothetical protein